MSKPKIVFLPHANLQYSQLPPGKRAWVVENTYRKLFDHVEREGFHIAFEASGWTVDRIAEMSPPTMDLLKALIAAGLVEPVASPYIHIMVTNVDPEIGYLSLVDGLDAWERHTSVRPSVGWNPECGWAHFVPDIYRRAGFESLVMDGDSFFLSFPDIRRATKLCFDVTGHSNKDKLIQIEEVIKDDPDRLKYLTNPSAAPNGLKLLFRSDMLANPMLWHLMGATEGVRNQPITIDEIREMLSRWKPRVEQTGTFIMPFAEDAEYIGSSAYFYVKQFNKARFFESEPASVDRFVKMVKTAEALGYETATPRQVLDAAAGAIDNPQVAAVGNGIAWHGGTAKAWANTPYARILDPVCRMMLDGARAIAEHTGTSLEAATGPLRAAVRQITAAYVSDSRWPPAPTSPGRFNVAETLRDLQAANDSLADAMREAGCEDRRSLYSPELMQTQVRLVHDELMAMSYFGEKTPAGDTGR